MSFANFDEILLICCDFELVADDKDKVKGGINKGLGDPVKDPLETHAKNWWELAEEEILRDEKEPIFI
jgi:hypothetical protein